MQHPWSVWNTWKGDAQHYLEGNTVVPGAGQGQKCLGGIGFVISTKLFLQIISRQFCLPRISVLFSQLDFGKTLKAPSLPALTMK